MLPTCACHVISTGGLATSLEVLARLSCYFTMNLQAITRVHKCFE